MSDLINRKTVISVAESCNFTSLYDRTRYMDFLNYCLNTAPTVDAVPVVRCKECKHSDLPSVMTMKYGKPGTLTCCNRYSPCNNRNVNKNDFCSYGEGEKND